MSIFKTISRIMCFTAVASAACFSQSCGKDENFGISGKGEVNNPNPVARQAYVESRRVLLFYECGFNSLYSYLYDDVNTELDKGYIPSGNRNDDVLLVYSKLAASSSYGNVKSYLRRIYLDSSQKMVSDTLKTFSESTVAASASTMKEVLNYVKQTFPAKGYGMVFSSHGSGWLPAGYYYSPSAYEKAHEAAAAGRATMSLSQAGIPEGTMDDDPLAGMTRSLGQDKMSSGDVEMTASEFASGIPYHLDYLLFDMCFSAGVEVVYTLKDAASYLGVSPAEVLADGMFDYTKITTYLLKSSTADLAGLFKDSFDRYDKQTGQYRSSTVTLVKTEGLSNLASVCKTLFEKYRTAIENAPSDNIQGYFRMDRHYFYDLEDLFEKCGASSEDLASLKSAIDGCVVYKNSTPTFLDVFYISTYSGFSVYLPCKGTTLLNTLYKQEPWNQATELVK